MFIIPPVSLRKLVPWVTTNTGRDLASYIHNIKSWYSQILIGRDPAPTGRDLSRILETLCLHSETLNLNPETPAVYPRSIQSHSFNELTTGHAFATNLKFIYCFPGPPVITGVPLDYPVLV